VNLRELISMDGIQSDIPRNQVALATKEDESLSVVRDLARQQRKGYYEKEGIGQINLNPHPIPCN